MIYTVHIETRAPDRDARTVDYQATDTLMELLATHDGVVSGGPEWRTWDATVSMKADDPLEAVRTGHALVLRCASEAGLPDWPTVRVEAIRDDVLEEELSRPNMPDLVSGPEAAEILGISRQRVHQLAAEHPEFPEPLYRLGVGSLWSRAAIERFDEEWERKPGRPRKSA